MVSGVRGRISSAGMQSGRMTEAGKGVFFEKGREDMTEIYLDGSEFESAREVHEFLAEELELPSWYGKNLDALYDMLTELCEDTRIVVKLSGVKDEKLLDYFQRMAEVMEDAADVSEYLEVEVAGDC